MPVPLLIMYPTAQRLLAHCDAVCYRLGDVPDYSSSKGPDGVSERAQG